MESYDSEPVVNSKIAAIEFTKGYTVHTSLNNMNRCMAYLSPAVMMNYVNNREASNEVLVYTIAGNQIEAIIKENVKAEVFSRPIQLSFSFEDAYRKGLTEEEMEWNRQVDEEQEKEAKKPAILRKKKQDRKKKIEGTEIYRRYFEDLVEVIPKLAKEWDFSFTLKEG